MQVEVITTSSVGGTVSGIQDVIDDRYYSETGLTFVILVGDIAQVPTYSGEYEGADSDPRYTMVEGDDLYPDLFISRISAANPVQVQTQINKFIRYERDPDAGGEWYDMATGVGSDQGTPPDYELVELIRQDLLAYSYTHVDQIYEPTGSGADITTALNDGRSLINYCGHGSGSSWSNPFFGTDDVLALDNGWAQPWIIDVSCSNGDFSINESFAEAWLRHGSPAQPQGAIAMYSASTSTPWVPPTVMQAETADVLVAEEANLIGALCFYGIMAVLDEYPGPIGMRLVEQYNLFGDCTLQVRTDTPNEMAISHPPAVPLFAPTFSVETGEPGVTCALYSDGVLHGVGVTDAFGHADIALVEPVTVEGEVQLTVFGYNQLTYTQILPAVVPADILISPATIPVGEVTEVTVTATDPDDGSGLADMIVVVEGYGVAGLEGVTDDDGEVTITVTPEYGESLRVRGRESDAEYFVFDEPLPVTGAMSLTAPSISAEVSSIGLEGALTPFIEGTVDFQAEENALTLYLNGGGLDVTASIPGNWGIIGVTPTELSTVTAALAKTGYEIFLSEIDVVTAYGTLNATLVDADAGNAPVEGVLVRGFPAGADPEGLPLFELTTAADGTFTAPDALAVGYYDIYATRFAYLAFEVEFFLMHGDNNEVFALHQAPDGVLTGTITDSDDGLPLEATVMVYRSDTGELYLEAVTDAESGVYSTAGMPYFDYTVMVRAYRHIPQSIDLTIAAASQTQDFALQPTNGDLLVLKEGRAAGEMVVHPPRRDDLGTLLAPGYTAPASRATEDMVAALEEMGYSTTLQTTDGTDPSSWSLYDLVIVSCGDNAAVLPDAIFRDELRDFVLDDGRLLLEGGELGYETQTRPAFANAVLHILDWNGDNSGDVIVSEADHQVMSVPHEIVGPIICNYTGWGDADRVQVAPDAAYPGAWSDYIGDGSVVAYDANENPQGGNIVSFFFNYSALATGERELLLQNAVNWLIDPETGPTVAVEEEERGLPTIFTLHDNYPNPFNPTTMITCDLPRQSMVSLRIYDVSGRLVRTLVDEIKPAAQHTIVWDGRDNGGRQSASGVYYYQLVSEENSQTNKMLLVK